MESLAPVSYTHLDVYKRQSPHLKLIIMPAWMEKIKDTFTAKADLKSLFIVLQPDNQVDVYKRQDYYGSSVPMSDIQGPMPIALRHSDLGNPHLLSH